MRIYGIGCTVYNSGLPEHNPKPSTERGKRRLAKCNDSQRKQREAAWGRSRSVTPSKLQRKLMELGHLHA